MNALIALFAHPGRAVLAALASIGRVALFALRALGASLRPPYYFGRLIEQMLVIGWFSLPVVGLTAVFTGAALAQQIFVGGSRFNAESTVPAVTVIAIVRELGPVLGGLMVAGRVSSAMAAELGTMRVTEQIDALTTLRTDPFQYLIAPRLIAAVIVLPVLVLVSNALGVMGGFLIGTQRLGFNVSAYLSTTRQYLEWDDVSSSLVKAAVFGFIIALMGCYHGFRSMGGAAGVGRSTTNAVVSAFVLILLANLIITVLVFGT
ncbi:MlaE family ABC transporter permease [Sphingosinicella soli]|uniref:Phospholipid/cholesterol/gamma-HCH transport system permease protein n=1 Tax=Sphingosinicella soli TaxID=333708 RepID=A0A7W7B0H3_9SPHN|nr:ABC transporter permease [Sphingosinicella soli]MBB4631780.1 phospholipid/cholesterol/gamma-HCH transport system permease protein [Sphingosinicella soli]